MTDPFVQATVDRILDHVKNPESGLSLAQLGLVKKVRVSAEQKKLTLFLKGISGPKACCAMINYVVLEHLELQIKQAFQRDFPGFEICLANG
nr:hypothetical protein [uncultured Desulfobacter sp.]